MHSLISKPLIVVTFTLALLGNIGQQMNTAVASGVGGPGGGNVEANSKLALECLLLDDSYNLKASLKNYINTVDLNQISDPIVKATLTRIGKKALLTDIDQTHYRIESGASEAYVPALDMKSGFKMQPAAVTEFSPNADVRFDGGLLFSEVKNLPEEDQVIAVASLAIHEHIHHFQTSPASQDQLLQNETEAYEFSVYVFATAKLAQVPLLHWAPQAIAAPKLINSFDDPRLLFVQAEFASASPAVRRSQLQIDKNWDCMELAEIKQEFATKTSLTFTFKALDGIIVSQARLHNSFGGYSEGEPVYYAPSRTGLQGYFAANKNASTPIKAQGLVRVTSSGDIVEEVSYDSSQAITNVPAVTPGRTVAWYTVCSKPK